VAFCTFPIANVGVFDLQSERMRVRLIRGRRFRILLLYHVRVRLSGGGKLLMNLSLSFCLFLCLCHPLSLYLTGGFLKKNEKKYVDMIEYYVITI